MFLLQTKQHMDALELGKHVDTAVLPQKMLLPLLWARNKNTSISLSENHRQNHSKCKQNHVQCYISGWSEQSKQK